MKSIKRAIILVGVLLILDHLPMKAQETNCSDRIDNDGDGDIDMFDTDCSPYSLGFRCTGKFYLTRQVTTPANATILSTVEVNNGTIHVSDSNSYSGILLNASFYYKGHIYAFGHTPNSNVLYQLKNDGTTSLMKMNGLPTSSWNNAYCTDAGMLYMLQNGTFKLWTVDLHTLSVTSNTIAGIADNPSIAVWGDMVKDPITGDMYCWYHPTSASSVRGLYKLDIGTNTFTFTGTNTSNTMGSLFFNSLGELYGYGSSTIGGSQDRFYSINKLNGSTTQIGIPDLQVTQTDACNCVPTMMMLPVEIVYLTAKQQDNQSVKLNWKTASERNNAYFIIQRSTDAITWNEIGQVKGKGTVLGMTSYDFSDEAPISGLSYYRLKQVDIDGKASFSTTAIIRYEASTDKMPEKIIITPNPVKDLLKIQIENKQADTEAVLYDAFGKEELRILIDSDNQYVDISHLPKGLHIISINAKAFKIIKE